MFSRPLVLGTLGLLLTIAPLAASAQASTAKPTGATHSQPARAASLLRYPGLVTTTWCRTPDDILKCTPTYRY
jgi:hypothetical protein